MRIIRLSALVGSVAALVVAGLPAGAEHATRPHTNNVRALGHSSHPATFLGEPDGVRHINSDIAFWEDLAFDGNYDGWRVIDISSPRNPIELAHPSCNGDQGDLVVWQNILVRSWNSPKTVDRTCLGQTVPAGWEGVHVFDISDPTDPSLEAAVELECGSHTATVAGVDDGDLIIYSNISSSTNCLDPPGDPVDQALDDPAGDFMDVIAVPLDDPASASLIHREPLAGPADPTVRTGCHDVGVILGDVNKAACASSDTTNVFDISDPRDPALLFTIQEPGVDGHAGRWHSGGFTWDGEVIILGWEPGGGVAGECESTDPAVKKSAFFYDADTGAKLGQWTLPRPQDGAVVNGVPIVENCTIHNYNVIPKEDRYVLVSGNYQAGTWITDFTDPANPETLGWSDPPVIVRQTPTGPASELGGVWSSYWYDGFVYESDITRGVNVFKIKGKKARADEDVDHLNPQTQEFTIDADDDD